MYRIGHLSKETNITIRTLRYYDELGLLKPSVVTKAGYRYYSKADVMKLQRITALKQLGFPLMRIKEVLAEEEDGSQEERWKDGIRLQLRAIEEEKRRLHMMEQVLYAALHALEMTGDVCAEEILLFIKAVQSGPERRLAFFQRYFTQDEIAILNALPELTTDDPRTKEWVQLLRDIRAHLHEPPHSPIREQLAQRVVRCAREFFHGNDELALKYWEAIRPQPDQPANVYGLDAELMAYIDQLLGVNNQ